MPHTSSRRVRAFVLAVVLALVALVAGGSAAQAQPVARPFDCKSAPVPHSPSAGLRGMIAPRPSSSLTADPWSQDGVPITSVYGYSWQWTTYDNGCGAGADWGPKIQTTFGNLLYAGAGFLVSLSHAAMREVADPSGWTQVLDEPVKAATDAVTQSVWGPWVLLTLLLVAVLALWRARAGNIPGVITAVGWAMVVLTVSTALMSYPVEASRGMDSLISTTITAAAGEYDDNAPVIYGPTGPEPRSATNAIDAQMDVITRDILWRQWVAGLLGTSDGPIADEFGPRLFRASHLSWAEDDVVRRDPEGAGKKLIERKQKEWQDAADDLKDRDAGAYDVMTGNQGRWGPAFAALFLALLCVPFLAAAALALVAAYLVMRLIIPLAPALGVVALLEPAQPFVMGQLRRLGGVLIGGPILFVAALVNLAFTTRIMDSTASPLVRYVLCLIVSVLLWKIVKPYNMISSAVGRPRHRQQQPRWRRMPEPSRPRVTEKRSEETRVSSEAPVTVARSEAPRPALAGAMPRLSLAAASTRTGMDVMTVRQRREASGTVAPMSRARVRAEVSDLPPTQVNPDLPRRRAEMPGVPVRPALAAAERPADVAQAPRTRPIGGGGDDGQGLRLPAQDRDSSAPIEGVIVHHPAPPIAPSNIERRDGRPVWVLWTPAGETVTSLEDGASDVE